MWIYSFSIPALVAKYNAVLSMQFQAMIQKNFLAKRRAWKRFTSCQGGGGYFLLWVPPPAPTDTHLFECFPVKEQYWKGASCTGIYILLYFLSTGVL